MASPTVAQIVDYLDGLYSPSLAADWDRVGLLLGRPERNVTKVMTALTVTPRTVAEAVREGANFLVSHHPFPFHPVRCAVDTTTDGAMLLDLLEHGIALYSPHTAHDGARHGINAQLAAMLGLADVRPLLPHPELPESGTGRIGVLPDPTSLLALVHFVKTKLGIGTCQYVGEPATRIARVAVCCGAADDFILQAREAGADALLLGEARFHALLEAQALGLALVLPGHYASERFAVERMAARIAADWPELPCLASRDEDDPLRTR